MSNFYKWSKNGMKMIVNSDFKEFNKQTNCISSGNVIANTMIGWSIRPYDEVECNGKKFEKGELQNSDLEGFDIHQELRNFIKERGTKLYLYEIFIHKEERKKVIGWLVEENGKIIYTELEHKNFSSKNLKEKGQSAIDLVKNIIEEDNGILC